MAKPPYKRKFNAKVCIKHKPDTSYWRTIGIAFEKHNGDVTVKLDIVPLPVDGNITFHLFENDDTNEESK